MAELIREVNGSSNKIRLDYGSIDFINEIESNKRFLSRIIEPTSEIYFLGTGENFELRDLTKKNAIGTTLLNYFKGRENIELDLLFQNQLISVISKVDFCDLESIIAENAWPFFQSSLLMSFPKSFDQKTFITLYKKFNPFKQSFSLERYRSNFNVGIDVFSEHGLLSLECDKNAGERCQYP